MTPFIITYNLIHTVHYTQPQVSGAEVLSFCPYIHCKFVHHTHTLHIHMYIYTHAYTQGINSRYSMPVEGLGSMFLEGCRSPSCLAVEDKMSFVRSPRANMQFFKIINRPFHYRSLADLIQAMPVKRVGGGGDISLEGCRSPSCPAAESVLPFFPQAEMPF